MHHRDVFYEGWGAPPPQKATTFLRSNVSLLQLPRHSNLSSVVSSFILLASLRHISPLPWVGPTMLRATIVTANNKLEGCVMWWLQSWWGVAATMLLRLRHRGATTGDQSSWNRHGDAATCLPMPETART